MRRRDKALIRELMLRLEAIFEPAHIYSISMHDEEMQVPGYTEEEIYEHLQQINRTGYILHGEAGSMHGIGFGGFTDLGHDYLDKAHAEIEAVQSTEPVPESDLEEIRQEIAGLRRRVGALESNRDRAEIEADLAQISIETDRPTPRRSFLKSFFASLRDNLMKAVSQEGVHQALSHLETFARLRGWL